MRNRRFLPVATIGVLALTISACSKEESSGFDTLPSTSTLVTDTTTTTLPDTTTSESSTTTSESSTTTSSTIPKVEGLALSATGLGDALFGADADSVVDYVNSILEAPTDDSGWFDPVVKGIACPGTQVRFVTWHDLVLFFTDESPAASGIKHFAAYNYGPPAGPVVDPYGLETEAAIGIGATVADLRAAYPSALVNGGDEISGPSFYIEDGLLGFLTGASAADTVISFLGGYGCGE